VCFGVDGSASTDAGHLLNEARQAMLLQRVSGGAGALGPREALRLATRGGAEVLGRDDCGSLEPGKRADLVIWPLNEPGPSGAWDPVATLLLSPPTKARHVMVEGRWVVRDGHLASADLSAICEAARRSRKRLMELA